MEKSILEKPEIETLGSLVIGAAISVHRSLGAGLRRQIYIECIAYELTLMGLYVQRDVAESVVYKDQVFESGVVLELLVDNQIALVCESVDQIEELHTLTLLNKIKHTGVKLGFIFNFNSKYLRADAIKRVINGKIVY